MGIFQWFQQKRDYGRMVSAMNHHWTLQEYIAIDMETTGLNFETDRILSIGWVQIKKGTIRLKSARHMLLKGSQVDTEAIGIHLITDTDLKDKGSKPKKVIKLLSNALSEKILIAHHAPIEIAFLQKIWQGLDMPDIKLRVIDTMALDRVLLHRKSHGIGQNALRLNNCRERYGLPDYVAHDALTDALAAGELFMAQASHLGNKTTLESLFRLAGKEVLLSGSSA